MNSARGFTLLESVLVIVLIAILSAIASPLFTKLDLFEDRFFLDQTIAMLRFGKKVAIATGCEVQVGLPSADKLGLFQREHCTQGEFIRAVPAPFLTNQNDDFIITVPKHFSLTKIFPIYFDDQGNIRDSNHQMQKSFSFTFKNTQVIVDGETGFAYEA
jgi:MSHA pilin protein MshC